ncbi:MAG: hypothetical protein C0167_00960 [Nitrososphaera sp.]|nr:MAG: hypothetical protein C0167_00960 [Nitrososphaera sp.]
MKHIKDVSIGKDSKGNPMNVITTERGYIIETASITYPHTDEYVQIVDMILNALENATLTLDPKTSTITISFRKAT